MNLVKNVFNKNQTILMKLTPTFIPMTYQYVSLGKCWGKYNRSGFYINLNVRSNKREREEIMSINGTLIKTIKIPKEQRKKTTLASNLYYDVLEIYDNKVIGYLDGKQNMVWYFKEYASIDIVKANMNSQFAQIIFLTGINSKNRTVGIDLFASQNQNAMKDTNRILFCSGMFSFGRTNDFATSVGSEIRSAFEEYKNKDTVESATSNILSSADEIRKFKELLDEGIITEDEFNAKKKQLLST